MIIHERQAKETKKNGNAKKEVELRIFQRILGAHLRNISGNKYKNPQFSSIKDTQNHIINEHTFIVSYLTQNGAQKMVMIAVIPAKI
jgi:hypothetical protein